MAPNLGLGTQGIQRGWGLWLTSVLAVVIAGLFVLARISQRFIKKTGLGLDDYFILAGLVSSVVLTVTECQGEYAGFFVKLLLTIGSCRVWIWKALGYVTS
jgi:uncharacterized membrane protein YhiD involved in acid resistance